MNDKTPDFEKVAPVAAAPGIDLEQSRELEWKCERIRENRDFWHGEAEKLREELFEIRKELAEKIAALHITPEGFVMVPVEPTEEMLYVAMDEPVGGSCSMCSPHDCSWDDACRVWAAMLIARPQEQSNG